MSEYPRHFDPLWFDLTIDVLDRHGARGFRPNGAATHDEIDRWHAGRTVFRLLPTTALHLRPGSGFRPVIRKHLIALGLQSSGRAELVLKSVAEQLISTHPALCQRWNRKRKIKMGISHVRASGKYQTLLKRQIGRCATCGCPLDEADSVELDHIVPFSFIGDVPDGANWRILCGACNLGKHSFISSWFSPDAWGWVSDTGHLPATTQASLRTRYSVIATIGKCETEGCGATAKDSHLRVELRVSDSFWTAQNLKVSCAQH